MLLSAVLESGVDLYGGGPSSSALEAGWGFADKALYARFQSEQSEHRTRAELQARRRETVLVAHHDRLIEMTTKALTTTRERAVFDRKARGILAAQEGKVRAAERAKDIALQQLPKATGVRLELFEHFIGFVSVGSN